MASSALFCRRFFRLPMVHNIPRNTTNHMHKSSFEDGHAKILQISNIASVCVAVEHCLSPFNAEQLPYSTGSRLECIRVFKMRDQANTVLFWISQDAQTDWMINGKNPLLCGICELQKLSGSKSSGRIIALPHQNNNSRSVELVSNKLQFRTTPQRCYWNLVLSSIKLSDDAASCFHH